MVETLKNIIGLTNNDYDLIIIVFCLVIVVFMFKYTLDLFAYLFGWVGGKR